MKISEVCSLTNLTKKAIAYYEKQNLIKPKKDLNGYREYCEEDVKRLKEISLYRKLDMPVKDIKNIINSKDKKVLMNNLLEERYKKEVEIKIQKNYIKRILEGNFSEDIIENLNEEIITYEKNSGEFVKKEMLRAFPKGIGEYLAHHFAPYLNEPMDTKEKFEAWIRIVDFLDNVPEIKIPKIIEAGFKNIPEGMYRKINEETEKKMYKMISVEGDELKMYEEKLLKVIEKQNSKSLINIFNPINKFKKDLYEFFNSSGYYEIFIPNMKVLSSDYKRYHENLMKFNNVMEKKFGIRYDENMRIIKL